MQREEKKAFGLVGTQIELNNSEMDTLVSLEKRVQECRDSFDTDKKQYLKADEYILLDCVLRVIIGDFANQTPNAFKDELSKAQQGN